MKELDNKSAFWVVLFISSLNMNPLFKNLINLIDLSGSGDSPIC